MQSTLGAQGYPCIGSRTGFYSTAPDLCGYRRSSLGLHKKRDLDSNKFEVFSLHLSVSGMRHKIAHHRQMPSTSTMLALVCTHLHPFCLYSPRMIWN